MTGKFNHHKYTWQQPFTSVRHNWSLVGPKGAVNFHVSIMDDEKYPPTAGLEFHHLDDHPYAQGKAPHHLDCPLTGGRCWHDGTSLYATEHLWPLIEGYLRCGEHKQIFDILEREYCQHFEGAEE